MKTIILLSLIAGFLLYSNGVFGDILSSSITCDGSYRVHYSIIEPNQSHALNIFTTDNASINRDIQTGKELFSSTWAHSVGSMGIDEYTSNYRETGRIDSPTCIFNPRDNNGPVYNEMRVSGLLYLTT